MKKNYAAYLSKWATEITPGGAQTLSKGRHNFTELSPRFIAEATGSRVIDARGREYVDWICGLAAVGLGYNDREVNQAVVNGIMRAQTGAFSLPTPVEIEVSGLLCSLIPCADMVRFVKTGSEADSGAVRIARIVTNREVIVQCGYTGWHDWAVAALPYCPGVPSALKPLVRTLPYNATDDVLEAVIRDDTAAVIMEPVLLVPPKDNFLQRVRARCTAVGALLIFDEIVCGFRWAVGGGQEYYGVEPDIATFGKAVANGYPLAAIVGSYDVMHEAGRFVSGTFGGETVALIAARATMLAYEQREVIQRMWETGTVLLKRITPLLERVGYRVVGFPVHWKIESTESDPAEARMKMSLLVQGLAVRGVLIHHGGNNVMAAHSQDDIELTVNAIEQTVRAILDGAELSGPPIEAPFLRNTGA